MAMCGEGVAAFRALYHNLANLEVDSMKSSQDFKNSGNGNQLTGHLRV